MALVLVACGAPSHSSKDEPSSGVDGAGMEDGGDGGHGTGGGGGGVGSGESTGEGEAAFPVPVATWDSGMVADHIVAAFALGLPEPVLPRDALLTLIVEGGDGSCPHHPSLSLHEDFSGCNSSRGYTFGGFSEYFGEPDGEGSFSLTADVFAINPAGERFEAAGEAMWEIDPTGGEDGSGHFVASLVGTWGAPGRSDWLADAPGEAIWIEGDRAGILVEGGFSLNGDSLSADDLRIDPDCPAAGRVEVRDPGGSWFTLDLPEDCSGCAPLVFGGVAGEDLCVDLRPAFEHLLLETGL